MDPVFLIVTGAVVLVGFLLAKKAAAETVTPDPEPDGGDQPDPTTGPDTPVVIGPIVIPEVPITTPDPKPGSIPELPADSRYLEPGFEGYFLIHLNDTMIKVAKRIGITRYDLRDHAENRWAKEIAIARLSHADYQKYDLILNPRYGKTVAVDCVAPGYKAKYLSSSNGQYPVLYWSFDGS